MSPELFATIAIQVIASGVFIGMIRQKQQTHDEKFNEQAKLIEHLDREKLDVTVHTLNNTRIDGNIGAISHRVSGLDQRVYGLETGVIRRGKSNT